MVKVEVVDKVSQFKCYYDRDFYPTKLLAFVEHIRIENTQETYAIVHSCVDSDSDYKRDSALTETWTCNLMTMSVLCSILPYAPVIYNCLVMIFNELNDYD